jgi:hypothetical protein
MNQIIQTTDLPRDWTPPDGLGYSRMRPVRLTGAGIAALALAIGGAAAGIALGVEANRQAKEHRLLHEHGTSIGAVVTEVWRSGGEDRQPWVAYRFESQGRPYQARSQAPLRIWRTLEQGSLLPVRLLPAEPTLNHPEDWGGGTIPRAVQYLVATCLAGPALLIAVFLRRQVRLLVEGRPAPGIVTHHSRADHGKTRNHYEFRLLSGAMARGRGEGGRPLPLGGPICVIYDPENPRGNTPYPLSLVRLANVRGTVGKTPGRSK